jgi:hypothetical protein
VVVVAKFSQANSCLLSFGSLSLISEEEEEKEEKEELEEELIAAKHVVDEKLFPFWNKVKIVCCLSSSKSNMVNRVLTLYSTYWELQMAS